MQDVAEYPLTGGEYISNISRSPPQLDVKYASKPDQGPQAVLPTDLKRHEKRRVSCQISIGRSARSEVMRSGSLKVEKQQSHSQRGELAPIQSHMPTMRLLFRWCEVKFESDVGRYSVECKAKSISLAMQALHTTLNPKKVVVQSLIGPCAMLCLLATWRGGAARLGSQLVRLHL